MPQTKKGNPWYFGMKAHIGVASKTKVIHSVAATAANVSDLHVLVELLHGDETKDWRDRAHQEQTEAIKQCASKTRRHDPPALLQPGSGRRSQAGKEQEQVEGPY